MGYTAAMALPKAKLVKISKDAAGKLFATLFLENGDESSAIPVEINDGADNISIQREVSASLMAEYDLTAARWDFGEK